MVAAGIAMPNCGTSRSRKVVISPSRQARESRFDLASHERGKPPRNQRRCHDAGPVSRRSKPPSSTNSTRPARVSEVPRTMSGEALPRTRNRVPLRCRFRQHAKDREQVGPGLDLVEHDQAAFGPQHELRVLQPAQVRLRLEVEERGVAVPGKLTRQRGLAALAWPEQCRHGHAPRRSCESIQSTACGGSLRQLYIEYSEYRSEYSM